MASLKQSRLVRLAHCITGAVYRATGDGLGAGYYRWIREQERCFAAYQRIAQLETELGIPEAERTGPWRP